MASFFLDNSTGKRYSVGVAQVEYDGRIYVSPTAATYKEIGLSEVTIQPRPDDNFYIVTGPDNTGSYNKTDRPLDDLKTQWVAKEKDTCNKLLSQTDWYIIRALEGGTLIPDDVSEFRKTCRIVCNANENKINKVKTISELEIVVKESQLDFYPEFNYK